MLEQYFKLQWIERKEHSFFLGLGYAIISIIAANLILPSFGGIVSAALTACLLIPSLNALLQAEENVEIREKKLHFVQLIKDHTDIFKVYTSLFFGVFTVYLIVPLLVGTTRGFALFADLLTLTGLVGKATEAGFITGIIINNGLVFLAVFVLSLLYGAGAIFYLSVNAATWGSFFGYLLISHQLFGVGDLITVLPHTFLEGIAYIFVAIAGGVLSKAIIREKIGSKKFQHVFTDACIFAIIGLIILLISAIVETIAWSL